jgi:hypothetical protein
MTIGIFAVWMPAALIAQRINNGNRLQFSWKKVLAGCPTWMRNTAYAVFIYAFANFFSALRAAWRSSSTACACSRATG